MVMFAFFTVVFSSVFWLIYAVLFIYESLNNLGFGEQSAEKMLVCLAVIFLPLLVLWMIFGYINQFAINRGMNRKQTELLRQLQKNQDYTDLVVRVMLDAEHEIKDGFVLNKFDIFISDMNEALGEVIQRCNIASSAQLEQLWQRVRRGERWTLGKAVLDASKNQSTFDAWAREKVNRDKVFRGSLLEFCSRYQNLLQLLEKHDCDRVFLRMIEAGVFGKVYSIIAPLSEGLSQPVVKDEPSRSSMQDYASVLKIATIEEPRANETIMNVDKTDEEDDEKEAPRQSFFSRLNPFRRHVEYEVADEEPEDPFFRALHSSFQNDGQHDEAEVSFSPNSPDISVEEPKEYLEPMLNADFGGSRSTLDSLRSANEELSELTAVRTSGLGRQEPSFSQSTTEKKPSEKTDNDEDLVYPFGGWTDEKNYSK